MTSNTCGSCGLNNYRTDDKCRRCGSLLMNRLSEDANFAAIPEPPVQSPISNWPSPSQSAYPQVPEYGLPTERMPAYAPFHQNGYAPASGGFWSDGKTLIMHKSAQLPDRCIKCNALTNGSHLKRNLTWHHPALALLILIGLPVYLIVALILRKSAKVNLSLCQEHIQKHRTALIVSWLLFLGGLLGVILGIAQESWNFALPGMALIAASAVYGTARAQVVAVAKMDDQYIWLKRINRDFLAGLPAMQK